MNEVEIYVRLLLLLFCEYKKCVVWCGLGEVKRIEERYDTKKRSEENTRKSNHKNKKLWKETIQNKA